MNRIKIVLVLLIFSTFMYTSCIKDEIYVDPNEQPDSEIELVINEVNSNAGDPNPDWIEIYNPGDEAVDISGFGVYDKPAAIYKFPAGTSVPAGGYFVIVCDAALGAAEPTKYGAFGISSGGESVFLVDATGAVIDEVAVPAMPLGVTYARIPDGGEVLSNANATKGAANSNSNEPPVITATLIANITDNADFDFSLVASDAGGIRDVKLFMDIAGEVKFIEMAPVGAGVFKYRIPAMNAATVVKYYAVATDETGKKTYFPETAPTTAATFTVANGNPAFTSVTVSSENPAEGEAVNFTVKITDRSGAKEVRLYYVINDALATTKTTVTLTTTDNVTFNGSIPGQLDGTIVRYYLRAEDNGGLKTYYPMETVVNDVVTSPFNHDVASTWPLVTYSPALPLNQLVINEIQASGTPYDYIELYNGTNATIDISGFILHDSGGVLKGYTFPAGTTIAAGEYFVLETGGDTTPGTFGISSSGEDITLINAAEAIVDQMLKINWIMKDDGVTPATLIARKTNAATKWIEAPSESKGTANNY